jgi:hypothetical protein
MGEPRLALACRLYFLHVPLLYVRLHLPDQRGAYDHGDGGSDLQGKCSGQTPKPWRPGALWQALDLLPHLLQEPRRRLHEWKILHPGGESP